MSNILPYDRLYYLQGSWNKVSHSVLSNVMIMSWGVHSYPGGPQVGQTWEGMPADSDILEKYEIRVFIYLH